MQRRFQIPVLVAAGLILPVVVVEQSTKDETLKAAAQFLNWLIWLVFVAELGAILAVTPNRWRWMRQHPLEPLVVVLSPPLLLPGVQTVRVLRLLRLLAPLMRLAQLATRLTAGQGVKLAGLLAGITAVAGGVAFADVEGHGLTTWDGVWWAAATMTTVGYGDLYPHTNGGRVIGLLVMMVGIGFIAVLTAAIAQRFVAGPLHAETPQLERAIHADLAADEIELRAELRAIQQQMRALEGSVERLIRRHG